MERNLMASNMFRWSWMHVYFIILLKLIEGSWIYKVLESVTLYKQHVISCTHLNIHDGLWVEYNSKVCFWIELICCRKVSWNSSSFFSIQGISLLYCALCVSNGCSSESMWRKKIPGILQILGQFQISLTFAHLYISSNLSFLMFNFEIVMIMVFCRTIIVII